MFQRVSDYVYRRRVLLCLLITSVIFAVLPVLGCFLYPSAFPSGGFLTDYGGGAERKSRWRTVSLQERLMDRVRELQSARERDRRMMPSNFLKSRSSFLSSRATADDDTARNTSGSIDWLWRIKEKDAKSHLQKVCNEYNSGQAVGSICQDLCRKRLIKFTKCLGHHGVKSYVFKAEWRGDPVIIKSIRSQKQHHYRIKYLRKLSSLGYVPTPVGIPEEEINENLTLSKEEFIHLAIGLVMYMYGIAGGTVTNTTEQVLNHVMTECDIHGDGVLHHDEIARCWQIVESEEYMISSLLQGNPALPKILGVCGELYAEEYVEPLDSNDILGYRSFLSKYISWKTRAKLALAILDLVEALEETPFGTLFYCDVKEANIGLATKGRLVAKVTDLDSGWFGDAIRGVQYEKEVLGTQCETNSHCDLMACHFACNFTSHTCTDRVLSNNLQAICSTIFNKRLRGSLRPFILQSPPTLDLRHQLDSILHKCSHPKHPQPHLPRDLLAELRQLLTTSIR